MKIVPVGIAAKNAISLLKQFTTEGKVDHKAFLAEMDARAAVVGIKLTAEQYGVLGQMAAAYENSLVQS